MLSIINFNLKNKLDIDECSAGIHNCSNNCINNIGSYTCDCPIGEKLDVDGLTCIGKMIQVQNKAIINLK